MYIKILLRVYVADNNYDIKGNNGININVTRYRNI